MTYNQEYKKLVQHILDHGQLVEGRNGNMINIPFASFTINAKDWRLNLRKMHYKGVEGEWNTLMDVNKPLTNVSQFEANGCNYWSLWADKDGELNLDYFNRLHPQLEDVIENIKKEPYSRRHVVNLWMHEHVQSQELSLACCWMGFVITVLNNEIHLTWHQRSGDLMLGVPADVYLAALFVDHIAEQTGYAKGTISFAISNLHIYESHLDGAKELMKRTEEDFSDPIKFKLEK